MLGALGILFPEVLEKYAGIEFGVRTSMHAAAVGLVVFAIVNHLLNLIQLEW